MAGRIQQNPDVGLRLEPGDPHAQSHGVGGGSVEIVYLDVEVIIVRCSPGAAGQVGGT